MKKNYFIISFFIVLIISFILLFNTKINYVDYNQKAIEIYRNYKYLNEKDEILDNYQLTLTYFSNQKNIEKITDEKIKTFINVYVKTAKRFNVNSKNF